MRKEIIALASATGGVGRTSLAIEMAKSMVKMGRYCLIVDFNASNTSMSSLLGVRLNSHAWRSAFRERRTRYEGVAYLPVEAASVGEMIGVLRAVSEMSRDTLILDLPTGYDERIGMAVRFASSSVVVGTGEPSSLIATTQWLRRMSVDGLREEFGEGSDFLSNLPLNWTFEDLSSALGPRFSAQDAGRYLSSLRVGYVLNQRRDLSEGEQTRCLCHAWGTVLGVWPAALPTIRYDERRWFFVRGLGQESQFAGEDTMFSDIVELASEVLKRPLDVRSDRGVVAALIDPVRHPYAYLQISDGGGDPRLAYRRLWEGYRREGGLISHVLDHSTIEHNIKNLEIAYRRTLTVGADELARESVEDVQADEGGSLLDGRESAAVVQADEGSVEAGLDFAARLSSLPTIAQRREMLGLSAQTFSRKSRIPLKILQQIERGGVSPHLSPSYQRAYEKAAHATLDQLEQRRPRSKPLHFG